MWVPENEFYACRHVGQTERACTAIEQCLRANQTGLRGMISAGSLRVHAHAHRHAHRDGVRHTHLRGNRTFGNAPTSPRTGR